MANYARRNPQVKSENQKYPKFPKMSGFRPPPPPYLSTRPPPPPYTPPEPQPRVDERLAPHNPAGHAPAVPLPDRIQAELNQELRLADASNRYAERSDKIFGQ